VLFRMGLERRLMRGLRRENCKFLRLMPLPSAANMEQEGPKSSR